MTEASRFRLLSFASYLLMGLLVLVAGTGIYLYLNLGKLGTELPLRSVNQFREIVATLPLVSSLGTGMDAIQAEADLPGDSARREEFAFTLGRLRLALGLIGERFDGRPPKDLELILDELARLIDDLQGSFGPRGRAAPADHARLRSRIDYSYAELRDYLIRVNDGTLRVLERQGAEMAKLREAMLLSSLVALIAACFTAGVLVARNRLMRSLEASREAAVASDRVKGEFLSNVSHELRTPINAILGFSDLALKGRLAERERDQVGKIRGAGLALLGVVNDILDFSSMEEGKLRLEVADFPVAESLAAFSGQWREAAAAKGLAFRLELDKGLPAWLRGDWRHLSQSLSKLLGNALKFTDRGEVLLAAGLEKRAEGRVRIRFAVCDTGIGMTEAELARVFQAFSQADGSSTRKFGGTGLGLSIASRLVALLGGTIEAESEPGQGSGFGFSVWFGLGSREGKEDPGLGEAAGGEPEVTSMLPLAGARILLAEDNDLNQEIAVELLKGAGAEVTVVGTGRQAVERLAERGGSFDVVLMDIQMPDLDGYEATRLIRSDPGNASLPVIAMTAHALEEARLKAKEAGLNDYIVKPLDASAVIATIRRHFVPRGGAAWRGQLPVKADGSIIPAIPGIDTDAGLRRVVGNGRLYLDLLRRFVEGQGGAVRRIREALATGDPVLAERTAHTLKGLSGNLGAVGIQELAAKVEAAIVDGGSPDEGGKGLAEPELAALEAALLHVFAGIREALAAAPASDGRGEARASARPVLTAASAVARLLALARESNSEALDFLEEEALPLAEACGKAAYDRLEGAIRSFDFPAAVRILQGLSGGPPGGEGSRDH